MSRPICGVCGREVTVVLTDTPIHLARKGFVPLHPEKAPKSFAVWCGCEATSKYETNHRGVGYGETEEAAIEAWKNWKPES